MKKFFTGIETLEELKSAYKKMVADQHRNVKGEKYTKATTETSAEFKDIIEKLLHMEGVIIEIIGCFIWLSGNTKDNKEAIKALGFKFSGNKKIWYKSPAGYRKHNKKQWYISDIRNTFGSEVVGKGEGYKRIES